ncbi:MAG: hypothetical protein IPM79_16690 [Polyangiaceae bacterium]|nr:hypothetical protein [Polyangiaceae bacterium]
MAARKPLCQAVSTSLVRCAPARCSKNSITSGAVSTRATCSWLPSKTTSTAEEAREATS